MAYLNVTTTSTGSVFARIATAFDAMATRYKQHRMYRDTLDALSSLTNRELADLGLHRSDLQRVSRDAAKG